MKKGNIHVDWAISMGIFLISLLALFLVFKPGIKAIYKEKVLLDIVDSNFKKEVIWTVKDTPLFITYLGEYATTATEAGPYIKVELLKNYLGNIDWIFNSYQPNPATNDFQVSQLNPFIIKCVPSSNATCSSTSMPYILTFHQTNKLPLSPEFTFGCYRIKDGHEEELNVGGATALCDYSLGATEDVKGINPTWLNDLKNLDYEALKRTWDYPEGKEFAIYQQRDGSSEEKVVGGDPFQETNVFVREIKYWLLTQEGNRVPITIYIRVW